MIHVQFGISTLVANGDSAQLALQVWGSVGACGDVSGWYFVEARKGREGSQM